MGTRQWMSSWFTGRHFGGLSCPKGFVTCVSRAVYLQHSVDNWPCTWLVVWNIFYFSIYWECHHPKWRSHIFQRGRAQPPTRYGLVPKTTMFWVSFVSWRTAVDTSSSEGLRQRFTSPIQRDWLWQRCRQHPFGRKKIKGRLLAQRFKKLRRQWPV